MYPAHLTLSRTDFPLLQVHPCGRYRHNTVVFILAKEFNLKNLRTIHRLDRLTSGLLMFGRNPRKAREMEQQIRNRQVLKEYVCRVEGEFPEWVIRDASFLIEFVIDWIGVGRSAARPWRWSATRSVSARCPHTARSVGLNLSGLVSTAAPALCYAGPSQDGCTRSGFICSISVSHHTVKSDVLLYLYHSF